MTHFAPGWISSRGRQMDWTYELKMAGLSSLSKAISLLCLATVLYSGWM